MNEAESRKLNSEIVRILSMDRAQYTTWNTKTVAYFGGWWRKINFTVDCYAFGVQPAGAPGNPSGTHRVGFLEHNPWGYPTVVVCDDEWQRIVRLLQQAVLTRSQEDLLALDHAIQGLADGKDYSYQAPYQARC